MSIAIITTIKKTVSASSYKDYMLGFIFYKYLSDKEEKYLKEKIYFTDEELKDLIEADTGTVKNCQQNIAYFISYENLFLSCITSGTDFQIMNVRTASK